MYHCTNPDVILYKFSFPGLKLVAIKKCPGPLKVEV